MCSQRSHEALASRLQLQLCWSPVMLFPKQWCLAGELSDSDESDAGGDEGEGAQIQSETEGSAE